MAGELWRWTEYLPTIPRMTRRLRRLYSSVSLALTSVMVFPASKKSVVHIHIPERIFFLAITRLLLPSSCRYHDKIFKMSMTIVLRIGCVGLMQVLCAIERWYECLMLLGWPDVLILVFLLAEVAFTKWTIQMFLWQMVYADERSESSLRWCANKYCRYYINPTSVSISLPEFACRKESFRGEPAYLLNRAFNISP